MKNRRNTIIVIGGMGFLLFVGLIFYVATSRSELERVRSSLQKRGERLSPAEIVTNLPPNISNGVNDLLSAAGGMPAAFGTRLGHVYVRPGVRLLDSEIKVMPAEVRIDGGRRIWSSNVWEEAAPYFETNRHTWVLAVDALTNDVIRTHLDWSKGFSGLTISHLGELKLFSAWAAMAVAYDLNQGDQDMAMQIATDGFRILGKYQGDPTLVGMMTRSAMGTILGMRTWLILQYEGWIDAQLREFQSAVSSSGMAGSMLECMEMERAMVLQLWEQIMNDPAVAMVTFGAPGGGMRKLLLNGAVRAWNIAPAHQDMSWYLQRIQDELDLARTTVSLRSYEHFSTTKAAHPTGSPAWWQWLSKVAWLDFKRSVQIVFKAETFREIQVAAIALKRHKTSTGKYPEKLQDLVPQFLSEVPVDWMDGSELRYVLEADGRFKLWSIGDDLKDQGGDPSSLKKPNRYTWESGRDWVWPTAATPSETQKFVERNRRKWMESVGTNGLIGGASP